MVKIRTRLILSFFLIASISFYFLTSHTLKSLRPHYLETMEESLVDHSQILVSFLERDIVDGKINIEKFRETFAEATQKRFSSKIYKLTKNQIDERVYVTDAEGTVIFDSNAGQEEGKNYSQWRDVYLTLRGQYGARMSHPYGDKGPSLMHIAAPITVRTGKAGCFTVKSGMNPDSPPNPHRENISANCEDVSGKDFIHDEDKIIGTLTVVKPTANINTFIELARPEIILAAFVAAISAVFLGTLVSSWITHPIQKLISYARNIRDGKKVSLPPLGKSEMNQLGQAFEEMRLALEGKKYIEQYVQHLTHELKSPIAAIQGASEILQTEVPPDKKDQFLKNIHTESKRMKDIVDRMLEIASLESRNELQRAEPIKIDILIEDICERLDVLMKKKSLIFKKEIEPGIIIQGEKFLIEQALMNLIHNAVDFSPVRGKITLSIKTIGKFLVIEVSDQGSGIPDYAAARVFEKFYSLPRPDTGKKSSGLGLSFVKEVARLHNGEISLFNLTPKGTKAVLSLLR